MILILGPDQGPGLPANAMLFSRVQYLLESIEETMGDVVALCQLPIPGDIVTKVDVNMALCRNFLDSSTESRLGKVILEWIRFFFGKLEVSFDIQLNIKYFQTKFLSGNISVSIYISKVPLICQIM